MEIITKKLDELIAAEYNPRQLSDEQFEQIKASLLRFGFVDPVIVNMHPDRKNIIVGGHQRVKVWKALGNEDAPCVEVNLPVEKERELNIRLNKNTGAWDWDELANHFDVGELCAWGFKEEELGAWDADDTGMPDLPEGDGDGFQQMTFTVSDAQALEIKRAINAAGAAGPYGETGNENGNGNALARIAEAFTSG